MPGEQDQGLEQGGQEAGTGSKHEDPTGASCFPHSPLWGLEGALRSQRPNPFIFQVRQRKPQEEE